MNYNDLNEIIDTDFLRLVLDAVSIAYENGYANVDTPDFKKVADYAETHYQDFQLAIQMGLAIQQCRNGLNPWCEKLAIKMLKELL